MNNVELIGRLTADPGQPTKTRGTPPKDVLNFRIAVNDPRRDKPVFVDVKCWGADAQNVAKYMRKGRQVAVSGELAMDEWIAWGGEKRSKHYINANRVEFLDPAPTAQSRPTTDGPAQAARPGAY
jgi:single-strand DNA-binding protein